MLKYIKRFFPDQNGASADETNRLAPAPESPDYLKKAYWLQVEQIEATGLTRAHADRIISHALVDSPHWLKNLEEQPGEYLKPPAIVILDRPTVTLVTEREAVLSLLDAHASQRLIPCKIGVPDVRGLIPLTLFASAPNPTALPASDTHTLWLKPGEVTLIGIDPDVGATTKARPTEITGKPADGNSLRFCRLKLLEAAPVGPTWAW